METVHVIRHKRLIEGRSIRWIAKDLGLHRATVKGYLERPEPIRMEFAKRAQPVSALAGPRIDRLLDEWADRTTKKHRITSPRVHRQLKEEGFIVGERTVRKYMAERRRLSAEVYIPLIHRPGDEGQVDFFEVTVDENGVRRTAWKFLMRLMYSKRDFVAIYDRCDQVSFLDGHVRAFEHFGAVPQRLIYDNLTAAVKRVIGLKERKLTDRFRALSSHYLFEPCFARPGEGHDKGGVESRGKHIRWQHMTPIVAGPDLPAISAMVMSDIDKQWLLKSTDEGKTLVSLFEEERPLFRLLPVVPFEPRMYHPTSVSACSICVVEGAEYSMPERWARLDAVAWIGARDIRFTCRGDEHLHPRRPHGQKSVKYRHYVRELSRKPQAVRQVAPELIAELGEPYGQLWQLLNKTHGALQGARILSGVLGAIDDHGEAAVTIALTQALAEGRCDLMTLSRQMPAKLELPGDLVPASLRLITVTSANASDYDLLLAGGAL